MANVNDPNLGKKPEPLDPDAAAKRAERLKKKRIKLAELQAWHAKVEIDPEVMARIRGALNGYNKGAFSVRYG
jgi:hypothetical protein